MSVSLVDLFSGFEGIMDGLTPSKPISFPWKPGKPSIDIVIPACGDDLKVIPEVSPLPIGSGLHMTIASCQKLLRDSGLEYRYFVMDNGNPVTGPFREALDRTLDYVRSTGRAEVIYSAEALSPPSARNRGAAAGTGDLLFFFDNHCDVDPGHFAYAIETYENLGADMVHGKIRGNLFFKDHNIYHHHLALRTNFWGTESMCRLPDFIANMHMTAANPSSAWNAGKLPAYKIASAGHGAFSVRRDVWEEAGGYWDGFVGFGGEEPYLDLKMAMLGKTNWLNPNVSHWHRLGTERSYKDKFTVFIENMLCSANIIGDAEWTRVVANSYYNPIRDWMPFFLEGNLTLNEIFSKRDLALGDKKSYQALFERALHRSDEHARWFAGKRLHTLDEQLAKFRREGVAM